MEPPTIEPSTDVTMFINSLMLSALICDKKTSEVALFKYPPFCSLKFDTVNHAGNSDKLSVVLITEAKSCLIKILELIYYKIN